MNKKNTYTINIVIAAKILGGVLFLAILILSFNALFAFRAFQNQDQRQLENRQALSLVPTGLSGPDSPPPGIEVYIKQDNGVNLYTLNYPTTYTVLENESVSVDRVRVPSTNTLTLISDDESQMGSFVITIKHKLVEENITLREAIEIEIDNEWCYFVTMENSEPYVLGGMESLIYKDTPCGPVGNTLIYTVNGNIVFLVIIQSQTSFETIRNNVEQVLSSFQFN